MPAALGAGCSTDSIATLSTAGATSFRAAFFTGARLGLVLGTVRFAFPRADLTTLRALAPLAEFRRGSLIGALIPRPMVVLAHQFKEIKH